MITVPWLLPHEAKRAAWETIESVAPKDRHNDRCVIPRRTHYHPDVLIVFAGAEVV